MPWLFWFEVELSYSIGTIEFDSDLKQQKKADFPGFLTPDWQLYDLDFVIHQLEVQQQVNLIKAK